MYNQIYLKDMINCNMFKGLAISPNFYIHIPKSTLSESSATMQPVRHNNTHSHIQFMAVARYPIYRLSGVKRMARVNCATYL